VVPTNQVHDTCQTFCKTSTDRTCDLIESRPPESCGTGATSMGMMIRAIDDVRGDAGDALSGELSQYTLCGGRLEAQGQGQPGATDCLLHNLVNYLLCLHTT
jgi:hypothetical protein